jgi:cell fate (sporulation/competence/biofilm development) regulator YlbF (YheA/YmcA/DUF963 family)
MANTQDLLNQAKALGEAIAQHPDVRAFFSARMEVEKDAAAQVLLKNYSAQTQRLQQLTAEHKPIEPEDKKKLMEFEQQLAGNSTLKKMMGAQVGYIALMNRVNQAMETPLAAAQNPA